MTDTESVTPTAREPRFLVYYIAAATLKGLDSSHVEAMCANLNVEPAALKEHVVTTCAELGIVLDSV